MPSNRFITISDNKNKIMQLLYDLVLTPRIKALEWSHITKQTPNMKIGYPGQHLASLITGIEGSRTGARGDDLKDGSEVKSCSRIDQLDTCNKCDGKVLRIEPVCSKCGSTGNKQGHILFSLTCPPLFGRISIWQESHGLLQPVFPIM